MISEFQKKQTANKSKIKYIAHSCWNIHSKSSRNLNMGEGQTISLCMPISGRIEMGNSAGIKVKKEQQQAGKDGMARGTRIKIKWQKNSAVEVILELHFANKVWCLRSSLSLYVLGNNPKHFHLGQQKRQQQHACKHIHSCAQKQPNTAQIFLCRVNDPESKSTALSLLLLLTPQRCLRCFAAFAVLVCLPCSCLLLLPPVQRRRHLGPFNWIPPMLWLGLGPGPYLWFGVGFGLGSSGCYDCRCQSR